ncbi:hypothetical protein Tco_1563345 [Tanacetum coccineum]
MPRWQSPFPQEAHLWAYFLRPKISLSAYCASPGAEHQDSAPLITNSAFDELLNGTTPVVLKSSDVHAADAPDKPPTQVPTVTAPKNIIQAETNTEYAQVDDDEFIIFSTLVQERGETSSRHVDSSKMHTFYQHHPSGQRWTKYHPLEQVIGNPSQLIITRHQLETNGEMCMFTLTVSQTEPKNIKEAMADSAWIEAMQEELHQFDRLDMVIQKAGTSLSMSSYLEAEYYYNSKEAIAISCNPVQHSRTKHIDVRYHFIKEKVEKGIVELFFVETEYQLADLFTKAMSEDRFKYLVRRLGMRCLTPEELEVLTNESA